MFFSPWSKSRCQRERWSSWLRCHGENQDHPQFCLHDVQSMWKEFGQLRGWKFSTKPQNLGVDSFFGNKLQKSAYALGLVNWANQLEFYLFNQIPIYRANFDQLDVFLLRHFHFSWRCVCMVKKTSNLSHIHSVRIAALPCQTNSSHYTNKFSLLREVHTFLCHTSTHSHKFWRRTPHLWHSPSNHTKDCLIVWLEKDMFARKRYQQ